MVKNSFAKTKQADVRGFLKNPLFYFGIISFFLFGICFLGTNAIKNLNYSQNGNISRLSLLFQNTGDSENNDLFFGKGNLLAVETPDLKIIQDNFVYGISTPRVLTTQTLGSIFGESLRRDPKEVIEYSVQPGDTVELVAKNFDISLNTLLWANNLSKNSTLKVGQALTILPVSGVAHVVKSGDTIGDIGKTYKAKTDDIITFNNLAGELDIFIGDILIVPDGVMPPKPIPSSGTSIADNFFIYPTEGKITQGLHWYNAIDVANKCGTPIYAAAFGTVQRAKYGWNSGGGNLVTILHSSGVVTYYGHLMTIFVKPGDKVDVGQKIGLMGGGIGMEGAGISTGCHLHFGVSGAKNPLSRFLKGAFIQYK